MSASSIEQRVQATTERIRYVLQQNADRLVASYYADEPSSYGRRHNVLFAGRHFDELGENPPNRFTPGDLAAASLLDVNFGPHAVRNLLYGDKANDLLAKIPANYSLWQMKPSQLEDRNHAIWNCWKYLTKIPRIGRTRASKLLARKRPHLMPILDTVIVRELDLQDVNQWTILHHALSSSDLRQQIDQLATAARQQGAKEPSTLRLLDVATWMTGSRSRHAEAVRGSLSTSG